MYQFKSLLLKGPLEFVYQLDNLFKRLFLLFQLILMDGHGFILVFVTSPSDQTFGHSILNNYDYNSIYSVLSGVSGQTKWIMHYVRKRVGVDYIDSRYTD